LSLQQSFAKNVVSNAQEAFDKEILRKKAEFEMRRQQEEWAIEVEERKLQMEKERMELAIARRAQND